MSRRNQSRTRRDINRLHELCARHAEAHPALAAILLLVGRVAGTVNATWKDYQGRAISAAKERSERDAAVGAATGWIRRWRPVVLLLVPGAAENLRKLPIRGATADDVIRVAEDMRDLVASNPACESFREACLGSLPDLEAVRREVDEATVALPAEMTSRAAHAAAIAEARHTVSRGAEIVRATFGPASAEYRQFVSREAAGDEADAVVDAPLANAPLPATPAGPAPDGAAGGAASAATSSTGAPA